MNKQIEEMAREMCHLSAECESCQICDEKYYGDGEPCYFQCVAKEILNHGYCKSTDVASNVVNNIFNNLRILGHVDFDGNIVIRKDSFEGLEKAYKKQYESETMNDEQTD